MPLMNPVAFDNPYYALGKETKLAEGVFGHLIKEEKKGVYIFTIRSKSSGKGYVSNFIKYLQQTETAVRFPVVVSPALIHLLTKNGFTLKREYVPYLKGHVEVYVWKKRGKNSNGT